MTYTEKCEAGRLAARQMLADCNVPALIAAIRERAGSDDPESIGFLYALASAALAE